MGNGIIITLTICIPLGIVSLFYYWLGIRKKRHLQTIVTDWNNFNKAITNNHIDGILKFGTELIWNEHLTMIQLKEMSELIKKFEKTDFKTTKTNEYKELKLLIYNKYLDWNMEYSHVI
ncbi:hypothetical protein [uncultured Kordia sp.]|uniref:hypothetical protein n=1 Tax=uncultured Kordia sp. TaxID=507699 RepID=UPI0026122AD8|nr:hypothetical protein [uncultured Kordia sp.]